MINSVLEEIFTNQWRVIGFVSVWLLVAMEGGFYFGLRLHRTNDEPRRTQIGATQGAILGILGLLLGFTFAMSTARYEMRRGLVLEEANSIGTTYLRAALLPESHQKAVEDALRHYVDVRLAFYDAGADKDKQAAAEQAAAQIQGLLWSHAVAAGKESPTTITVSFINALNDTIDVSAKRTNALETHVPGAVWLLVLAVAACACAATGYGAGASGARSKFTNIALPLLLAVVITLIADLDRPRGGLIGISQQPMLDLKQSLQPGEP
jgi:hypothetical protein